MIIDQSSLNVIFGGICACLGWILKTIWSSLKELQKADTKLAKEVSDMKILVAGDYVKREYLEELAKAVFTKLDKIYDKLDQKMDK